MNFIPAKLLQMAILTLAAVSLFTSKLETEMELFFIEIVTPTSFGQPGVMIGRVELRLKYNQSR